MKVSIITVCLNSEETIEQTIRSVLAQTYPEIEYLVVDGGSKDRTLDIINKYRQRISRFVSEPDKGMYDAMNKGLDMASGEVIGFLNSDDLYASPQVIERVVAAMKQSGAKICWGDIVYFLSSQPDKVFRFWKSSSYEQGRFQQGWSPPHPGFFVKKEVYDQYGGFRTELGIAADYEIMLRFLEKHRVPSCYLPQVLVKMRWGGYGNRNPWRLIKGNLECYRAWSMNGMKVSSFLPIVKPLTKISQFLKKH